MRQAQPAPRILIVDDSEDTLEVLQRNLASQGFEVSTAPGVREAVESLSARAVDVVITDLKMPGISGLDLVRHVRENLRDTEVLMITGYPSVEGAVQAVKSGAEDFLAKPFTDEELARAVQKAMGKLKARRAAARGTEKAAGRMGLLGDSEAMRRVQAAIERAAASQAAVLLIGEPGTGKERVARAIHYSSDRGSAPFVPVNITGVPQDRLEGELFGPDGKAGFFRAAAGGTLFLDGVEELGAALQGRLGSLLDQRAIVPSARLVSATGKDLLTLVKRGHFREDLFYRLSVVAIGLPPLRDRGDDVLLLAQHFANRFAVEADRSPPRFTDQALEVFRGYNWPGNVRELENVVQRMVVMGGPRLEVTDLPALMRFSALREKGLRRTLAEVEEEHIRAVLEMVEGNRTRAAEILGIDRKTLREKMKRADGH
jgi:DNA-binding NtrC family response regulator